MPNRIADFQSTGSSKLNRLKSDAELRETIEQLTEQNQRINRKLEESKKQEKSDPRQMHRGNSRENNMSEKAKKEIEELKQQLVFRTTQLQKCQTALAENAKQLEQLRQSQRQLMKQLAQESESIDQMKRTIELLRKETRKISDFEYLLSASEEVIGRLKQENLRIKEQSKAKAQNLEHQRQRQDLNNTIDKLRADEAKNQERILQLNKSVASVQAANKQLAKKLEAAQSAALDGEYWKEKAEDFRKRLLKLQQES